MVGIAGVHSKCFAFIDSRVRLYSRQCGDYRQMRWRKLRPPRVPSPLPCVHSGRITFHIATSRYQSVRKLAAWFGKTQVQSKHLDLSLFASAGSV